MLHKKWILRYDSVLKKLPRFVNPNFTQYQMFTIHRFPFLGKRFFKRIRKIVGCVTFSHLWRLVIGIASINGRKSFGKFTKLYGHRRTRQALSHFFDSGRVGCAGVFARQCTHDVRQVLSLRYRHESLRIKAEVKTQSAGRFFFCLGVVSDHIASFATQRRR